MLYKVFDFASKEVSAVMVPRPEVVAISVAMPPEEALGTILDSPYTRYPVYRESLDDIVGILHVRDLFAAMHDQGIAAVSSRIVRPAYVVPETKDLAALLADFRREKQHMAIVVDEYGAMEGIVTLEDILEEIVGEIEDEFDLPDESVERIDEKRIRIDGTFTIDDFNEQFETELEQGDYHTMAGLVFGELGRQPEVGDEVAVDGLRLEVLEVDGSRIGRIEVEFTRRPARGRTRSRVAPPADRFAAWSRSRLRRSATATSPSSGCLRHDGRGHVDGSVAIGWQVYAVRENPLDLGLIGLAEFLPLLILALPAGHVADRFPRRTVYGLMVTERHRRLRCASRRDGERRRSASGRFSRSRS